MNQVNIIETKDLTKVYGDAVAVDKLNMRIGEGDIFGFLGPNGAGKTTTILMLLGLTEPTSGEAKIFGFNPNREPVKVKRIVGYLPEKVGFYEDLTARQNLEYTARLNGFGWDQIPSKIKGVIESVGLIEVIDQQVGKYSHGMKQRLGIADVMIKDPKVIFFDEPTSGIDPKGADEVLNLIKNMAKKKITAVISSHQLHHVQKVCTQVGIMAKGRLVAEGSIDLLGRKALAAGKYRIEVQASPITTDLISAVKNIKGVIKVDSTEDMFLVSSDKDLRPQISKTVVGCDSIIIGMKMEQFDLEEIYLKYFKES